MWAIFYDYIRYAIELLWLFKIEILAGLFVGLTIYAYFYRVLANREKNLTRTIKDIDYIMKTVEIVTEKKGEVQTILDAVAGFNNSIHGFKDSIVTTMRNEMKELKVELKEYFKTEVSRINKDIDEIKIDVDTVKKDAVNEKIMIRQTKNKLAMVIAIAVFVSSLIIGVVQHFLFKAL